MDNQERHYNIKKLNRLFAIASVILLICLLSMFGQDYSREWKDYQREFRKLEIEKTKTKYEQEASFLDENDDYKDVLQQIAQAQEVLSEKSQQIQDSEKKLEKLLARRNLLDQKERFAKAEYDALKYEYEAASAHHGQADPQKLIRSLEQLKKELDQLRLDVEGANADFLAEEAVLNQFYQESKDLEKNKRKLRKKADILEQKLKKLDPEQMSLANRVGDVVRDLPVLDLANPNQKIEQIVLKDLTDDVNFMRVPKVDRCITCHLGITNPDYKDAPQPFTTHPNLELFLSVDSAHPVEEFGCTVCHGGRGRGTDFVSSAHTPSSSEQKKEWKEKYHWKKDHHWEHPMLPTQYTEASCFKCHSGETVIQGAEKLNLGLHLIEKAGCYSCHVIEKYADWPKTGPDLTKIAEKTNKTWSYLWIQNPKSFRHDTWMPAFFHQSNNSDPDSKRRTDQEIHAIVHYLFEKSQPFAVEEIPFSGDAKNGEELVASIGCLGCHEMHLEEPEPRSRDTLRREYGPNLIGMGSKTSRVWLYNWLKNPDRYHPETRMPNMRLTDQEAADIAVYLAMKQNQRFLRQVVPSVDESALNDIVREFLMRSNTVAQTEETISKMNLDEKLLYSGEKLIGHYGCYACHNIAGFENTKPIGTELTYQGSKSVDRLDFGFIPIEHSRQAWFTQKLKEPRIFDKGKIKTPYEKLRMPNYYFTDAEAEAIVTALLGFVKDIPPPSKLKPRTPENLFIEAGQEIVRQFNCQGCHIMEGEGGSIEPEVQEWLVNFENRSEEEAKALASSFSAPNLIGQGKKVQAQWLFHFLHHPSAVRPWLKIRMPTFNFDTDQLNDLLKYFNALDGEEFPFADIVETEMTAEEYAAAEKLFSNEYFDCASCHIVGDQMPAGSPDRWAPNFALAKTRLKPDWIIEWIKNPQALLPGTKMPTYFDEAYFEYSGPDDILDGDENEHIRVLRDYIMSISDRASEPLGTPQPLH